MRRSLVFLVVLAAACGSRRPGTAEPNVLQLCVQNETVGYGSVTARAGPTRFNVQSGREVCRRLQSIGSGVVLQAQTLGGGAAGPLSFRTTLPSPFGCWRWRLTNTPPTSLVPCDWEP
ncbi:MAG: hypothetical protein H0X52_04975 [Gemmatimonadetes bacterium]|nr:hypothetical protein [Gemmatimonadota bacterium]MDQ3521518.1 hypothetical protein [Gemmatimonadota bacterium]